MNIIVKFWHVFRLVWIERMAYRSHFFMMITGKVIRIGLWTFDRVLPLFATFHVVDYLMSITFHRNLATAYPGKFRQARLTGEGHPREGTFRNMLIL